MSVDYSVLDLVLLLVALLYFAWLGKWPTVCSQCAAHSSCLWFQIAGNCVLAVTLGLECTQASPPLLYWQLWCSGLHLTLSSRAYLTPPPPPPTHTPPSVCPRLAHSRHMFACYSSANADQNGDGEYNIIVTNTEPKKVWRYIPGVSTEWSRFLIERKHRMTTKHEMLL